MEKYNGLTPTVYIAHDGNDSTGDGTENNPWLTLSKAHSETSNGDIIGFKNGTYIMTAVGNFDMNQNRFYVGEEKSKVILSAENLVTPTTRGGWQNGTTDSNTEIHNIRFSSYYILNAITAGTLQHFMGTGTSRLDYYNCEFIDLSYSGNGQAGGLMAGDSDQYNVRFFFCIWADLTPLHNGSQIFNVRRTERKDWELYSCTIVITGDTGFNLNIVGGDNYVTKPDILFIGKNNIIANYSTSPCSLTTTPEAPNFISENNCYFNLTGDYGTGVFGSDIITADPKFIDRDMAVISNLRQALALQTISPCIGTGTGSI